MGTLEDQILGTREEWQKIASKAQAKETLDRETARVSKAMYEADPSQDHIERRVEARNMLKTVGADKADDIIGLVKQGSTPDEIIATLKKNDGGIGYPPP